MFIKIIYKLVRQFQKIKISYKVFSKYFQRISDSMKYNSSEVEFKLKGETSFQWSDDESYTDSDGKSQTRSVTRSGSETYFKSNIILKSDTGGTGEYNKYFYVNHSKN